MMIGLLYMTIPHECQRILHPAETKALPNEGASAPGNFSCYPQFPCLHKAFRPVAAQVTDDSCFSADVPSRPWG